MLKFGKHKPLSGVAVSEYMPVAISYQIPRTQFLIGQVEYHNPALQHGLPPACLVIFLFSHRYF